jgi:hypothetical protein
MPDLVNSNDSSPRKRKKLRGRWFELTPVSRRRSARDAGMLRARAAEKGASAVFAAVFATHADVNAALVIRGRAQFSALLSMPDAGAEPVMLHDAA